MLLACGEDETKPDEGGSDAASEADAGGSDEDAGAGGSSEEAGADASSSEDAGADASSSEDAGADASEPAAPGLVLSGALTQTLENVVPSSSWSKNNDQGTLIYFPSGGEVQAAFTFTFSGPPEHGETYDQALDGFSCALTVARASDNASWDAVHGIQGETDQGSCSFTLTAVEEILDVAALKQFEVHGTVEGTLPAMQGSGAEGSVMMRGTF